ncbi:MAG: rod shape-determining protein RodA [Chthonomonas sp.]|nr:rod shape-determining protein RodA [Chthonomonas sp.]
MQASQSRVGTPTGVRTWGDPVMLISAVLLLGAGLLSIYSIDHARQIGIFKKQVVLMILGLAPFFVFWRTSLSLWQKHSGKIYLINIALLVLVFLAPKTTKGAGRWVDIGPMQFQPSEFSKLAVILAVAAFYAENRHRVKEFRTFATSFLYLLPTVLLIFKQPHLGATISVLAIWFMISLVAGVPWRTIATVVLIGIIGIVGILKFKPELVLKDYQIKRVQTMKDKSRGVRDVGGSDYQVHEAQKAFANGGVTGSGFLKGEQTRLGFIPEQHNDFVFTVVGEEGGLVGAGLVLSIFGVFFFRVARAIVQATDVYSRLVATGILTILGFHTLVNLGMNIGILPVVGLWLPFLSAGGTAVLLCMGLVGLAMAVSRENERVSF